MSIQTFGLRAFREAVGVGIRRAQEAEEWIVRHPRLELLSPASLGIVTYRYRGGADAKDRLLDLLNRRIQERIVMEGTAMVSSTRLDDRFALRFCILNPRTRRQEVEGVLTRVVELGDEMRGDAP